MSVLYNRRYGKGDGVTGINGVLDRFSQEARLVQALGDGEVRCLACAQRCLVRPGKRGICQVRYNRDGKLYAPWGYVARLQADPVEKKPFYHFLPGATALTFGMLGCNFHCAYCQNWQTSQAGRDPACDPIVNQVRKVSPEQIVAYGKQMGAQVLASSYNEPLITSEWAAEVFKEASQAGMKCVMVSNGYATPEVLEYLQPVMAGYKIDLKTMQDKNYRSLGGILKHVLDSIQKAHDLGMWVEVVTLLVPGFNDSNAELWELTSFLREVSPDIPWHITAFHKDYHMQEADNTPATSLLRAAEIGCEAGLNYVYAGNLPGRVEEYETTFCQQCRTALIKRRGFHVLENRVTASGSCPQCGTSAAGVWS
jgi:pyruvate formate lyase activating enzyme